MFFWFKMQSGSVNCQIGPDAEIYIQGFAERAVLVQIQFNLGSKWRPHVIHNIHINSCLHRPCSSLCVSNYLQVLTIIISISIIDHCVVSMEKSKLNPGTQKILEIDKWQKMTQNKNSQSCF